jgi:hypothetical protein
VELRLAFLLALVSAACRPEIGDPCEVSTDCSPTGERLCDITQKPGGYCTVFNCEPDECPEEAVCVKFGDAVSVVEGCDDPLGSGPYARTYCLKKCGENNDCREDDGYKCLDPRKAWGAVVLDPYSKICGIPPKGNPVPKLAEDAGAPDARSNDVCTGEITPSDGGETDGGGGATGAGGAGGAASDPMDGGS